MCGKRGFSLLTNRYKFLKRGEAFTQCKKILSEKQAYVADLKARVEVRFPAASSLMAASTSGDTKLRRSCVRQASLHDREEHHAVWLSRYFSGDLAEQFQGRYRFSLLLPEEDPHIRCRICASTRTAISPRSSREGWLHGRQGHGRCRDQRRIAKLPNREHAVHVCRRPHQHSVVWPLQCRLMPTSRRSPLPDGRVTAA